MKVLVITPGVLPVPAYKGGAVEKLIEALIEENEVNYTFDFVMYTMECEKNFEYKHTKIEYINTNSFFYKISRAFRYIINNKIPKIHIGNAFINQVVKQLKKDSRKYDVILIENNSFAVLKLRKLYPDAKIILHLHNDYLNENTKKSEKILTQLDGVIAISEYIKSRVETIFKTDKISVVYNGVNTEIFNRKIDNDKLIEYRKKYNIKDGDIVLLYTGRLVKEKGVKELIIATNKLIDYNSNIKLLIVGNKASSDSKKDKYIYELNKLAKKHKDNIIFTGFINYENLPIFHQISNIQIIPSKFGEPLGNVVIEGLASGIKMVVTNDGGIVELVKNTDTITIEKDNLVENLYNALIDIITKADFEKNNNKDIIKNFSEKVYTNNIFQTINNL